MAAVAPGAGDTFETRPFFAINVEGTNDFMILRRKIGLGPRKTVDLFRLAISDRAGNRLVV
ncbi:MAG: hypothetical protein EXR07_16815 [Acetobacteraceae bacterium]|nr:hypothetical protein [Acetobacteraceae bacterium]